MTSVADNVVVSTTPTASASQEQQVGGGRGGRREERFAHRPRNQFDSSHRGRRGGRGGSRGSRAGEDVHSRQPVPNAVNDPTASMSPPPGLGGSGSFGARLNKDVKNLEGEETVEGNNTDVEAEVCFICASPVVHNSVAPCNHRTCHICALRLRALYKTKACAHCRVSGTITVCHRIIVLIGMCGLGRVGVCCFYRQPLQTIRGIQQCGLCEARRHVGDQV